MAVNGASPRDVLAAAASLEARSEHPLGRAIVDRARADGIDLLAAGDFQSLPGRGAHAEVGGARVLVGSHRLFEERGLCSSEMHVALESLAVEGRSTVMVASDGAPVGVIGVSDRSARRRGTPWRSCAPRACSTSPC